MAWHPLVDQGLLIVQASRSHSDTPQSVVLLWTRDQRDASTSTWQHTAITTDKQPCPPRDSKPQYQPARGRRRATTAIGSNIISQASIHQNLCKGYRSQYSLETKNKIKKKLYSSATPNGGLKWHSQNTSPYSAHMCNIEIKRLP